MTTPSARLAVAVSAALLLSGCSGMPRDPDHSLDRIREEGQLRVGVAVHPPFTDAPEGTSGDPTGSEVDLVQGFAERLGAEPEYVIDGEEALVTQLEEGEIDVLVGGLTKKNKGLAKVGMTRPYDTAEQGGKQVKLVMATVPGENALLSELERYLDGAR